MHRNRSLPQTLFTLLIITEPSRPAFAAIWYRGASRAFNDNLGTCLLVAFQCINKLRNFLSMHGCMRIRRRQMIPSSTAALVACKSIFHTKLCFLHLCLCSSTYTDNCNTACQLSKSFLKLLSVEIRCCFFNLRLDLSDSSLDLILITFTINDDCVLFLYLNRFSTTTACSSVVSFRSRPNSSEIT